MCDPATRPGRLGAPTLFGKLMFRLLQILALFWLVRLVIRSLGLSTRRGVGAGPGSAEVRGRSTGERAENSELRNAVDADFQEIVDQRETGDPS